MTRFILMRLLRAVLTMLIVHAFTFVALRAGTDVADQVLSWNGSPEAIAAFNERWGLDQPLLEQYATSLRSVARGDFGLSFRDGREAIDWVAERLPKTLLLSGCALLLSVLLGIPAGIYAALRHGALADRLAMGLATMGYSLPSFVLGLVLIYVFAVWLQVLPSSGTGTWQQLIMPVVVSATASTTGAAALARFTRSAMLDVMGQPYILTARAAGVPRREIIVRHALPNAAIPLVTYLGFAFGATVGGAIVVETVFAWPGLGLALAEAVGTGDLPIVQTMVILFALFMVVANFLVDIAYGLLNPKIRLVAHED